jgi:hypothetical protein
MGDDVLALSQLLDALRMESSYAGRGRSYGRAHVFTEDDTHVASFVQDAMIRSFPDSAGERPVL